MPGAAYPAYGEDKSCLHHHPKSTEDPGRDTLTPTSTSGPRSNQHDKMDIVKGVSSVALWPARQVIRGVHNVRDNLAEHGKDPVVITISTGDVKQAGTDNKVMISLIDVDGHSSKSLNLNHFLQDNFEQGRTDKFVISNIGDDLGEISCIELWREGLLDLELFLNVVFIKRVKTEKESVFPIHRWIPKNDRLRIREYDSFLPQNDPDHTARRAELELKRGIYEVDVKTPGIPVQCSTLPKEQSMSTDYLFDLGPRVVKLALGSKLGINTKSNATTLADLKEIYIPKVLPLPKPAAEDWYFKDEYFAEQRLSGCNPLEIKLCTTIPSNFAVTSDMLEPFLEGKTMAKALEKKRLFLTDYAILKDLNTTSNEFKLVAPLGLFYLTDVGKLLPVAIQLQQDPQDDNPVFLPSDPEYTWTIVKMWYNMADASLHQAKSHLGFTHLIVESICVITHRQLSPSHPVFRLLAPHFIFLIAINNIAFSVLVKKDGWVDEAMTMGRLGMYDIIRRKLKTWRMNVEGTLPADIQHRGVGPDVLPHYPYRDDAMALYDVIKDYVRAVIDGHYDSEAALTEDVEIQAWVEELTRPVADAGAGLQGVPGGGTLTNTEDLIDIVTFTIFTSSVQHAAVNFNQYEQYGFPAIFPAHLNGSPPTTKDVLTKADIVDALPSIKKTADIIFITSILSERATNTLSNFEVQYGYDDIAQKALTKLQNDLKRAREGFLKRSSKRQYSYTVLDPEMIPNAISI